MALVTVISRNLKSLVSLNLHGNYIGFEGTVAVWTALATNHRSLKSLHLNAFTESWGRNRNEVEGAVASLSSVISGNIKSLECWGPDGIDISDEGVSVLASSLTTNRGSVEFLSLLGFGLDRGADCSHHKP
mmetsp:Transcript_22935/g.53149  ORF Transcript_22935/g.53149 Transcript_22935/m.53149 type:complete len:131 (+) Transcript_22935:702-1094(+)